MDNEDKINPSANSLTQLLQDCVHQRRQRKLDMVSSFEQNMREVPELSNPLDKPEVLEAFKGLNAVLNNEIAMVVTGASAYHAELYRKIKESLKGLPKHMVLVTPRANAVVPQIDTFDLEVFNMTPAFTGKLWPVFHKPRPASLSAKHVIATRGWLVNWSASDFHFGDLENNRQSRRAKKSMEGYVKKSTPGPHKHNDRNVVQLVKEIKPHPLLKGLVKKVGKS